MASYSCGMMVNMAPLYESESGNEVARALNLIWPVPESRLEVTSYDLGWRRRDYVEAHADPGWVHVLSFVDRWRVVSGGCQVWGGDIGYLSPHIYAVYHRNVFLYSTAPHGMLANPNITSLSVSCFL